MRGLGCLRITFLESCPSVKKLVLTMFLFLLIACVAAREAKKDSESGRIRALYFGDAWGPTPFFHIDAEPSFVASAIPATLFHMGGFDEANIHKFMRIYMPRNYGEFSSRFDLLILSDTNRGLYRDEHLLWFRQGVREAGIGLMMIGGVESFGADKGHPSWGGSYVEETMPVLCLDQETFRKDFGVVVNHPDDRFIRSLPWETMPIFHGMNVVTPKEGSKILLQAGLAPYHPILVYWEYGEGSSLAHAPDWTPGWGLSIMYYWDYYPDYIANMNYLAAGVEIPQNPELIHQIRSKFEDYALNVGLTVSLMEFVERFGGKTSTGQQHLDEIASLEKEAEELYIGQEYSQVLLTLEGIEGEFRILSEELVELKERALFWIYVAEWLVVSATAMVCGVVLWLLMIKRHLYREVRITRAKA